MVTELAGSPDEGMRNWTRDFVRAMSGRGHEVELLQLRGDAQRIARARAFVEHLRRHRREPRFRGRIAGAAAAKHERRRNDRRDVTAQGHHLEAGGEREACGARQSDGGERADGRALPSAYTRRLREKTISQASKRTSLMRRGIGNEWRSSGKCFLVTVGPSGVNSHSACL